MPPRAVRRRAAAIDEASDIVGYGLYLDLCGDALTGKTLHESGLGAEEERARAALDLAASGRSVALVSSGDAGIYGLATLVFELLDREERPEWRRIALRVVPGISAMQAAAARLGAPLGHDFCAISLSDLLTPWPQIERRLEAAAEGDFVIALYNPRSARRTGQLERAREILLRRRAGDTPVALARNLGRAGESVAVTTLAALDPGQADMLTLVIVGSSATRKFAGRPHPLYAARLCRESAAHDRAFHRRGAGRARPHHGARPAPHRALARFAFMPARWCPRRWCRPRPRVRASSTPRRLRSTTSSPRWRWRTAPARMSPGCIPATSRFTARSPSRCGGSTRSASRMT